MFPPRLPKRPRRRKYEGYYPTRHAIEEMEELYEFITDRYFEWQYMKEEEQKKKEEEDKSKKKKETFFTKQYSFGTMLLHSMWIGPLISGLYITFIFTYLRMKGFM